MHDPCPVAIRKDVIREDVILRREDHHVRTLPQSLGPSAFKRPIGTPILPWLGWSGIFYPGAADLDTGIDELAGGLDDNNRLNVVVVQTLARSTDAGTLVCDCSFGSRLRADRFSGALSGDAIRSGEQPSASLHRFRGIWVC